MTDDSSHADHYLLGDVQPLSVGYPYHDHAFDKIKNAYHQAELPGGCPPQVAAPDLIGALLPEVYSLGLGNKK